MAASSYRLVCSDNSYKNDEKYFGSFQTLLGEYDSEAPADQKKRTEAISYIKEAINKKMGKKFYFLSNADLGCIIDKNSYDRMIDIVSLEGRIKRLDDWEKKFPGVVKTKMEKLVEILKDEKIAVETINSPTGKESHYQLDGLEKGKDGDIIIVENKNEKFEFQRFPNGKKVNLKDTGAELKLNSDTHKAKIVYGKSQITAKSLDDIDLEMIKNEIKEIDKKNGRPQTA